MPICKQKLQEILTKPNYPHKLISYAAIVFVLLQLKKKIAFDNFLNDPHINPNLKSSNFGLKGALEFLNIQHISDRR